jgi:hypothetical protein
MASLKIRTSVFSATLILLCFTFAIAQPSFSSQDQAFLDDLEHRSFQYFWDQADPETGLVPDRARMDGSALDDNHRDVASTASNRFRFDGELA